MTTQRLAAKDLDTDAIIEFIRRHNEETGHWCLMYDLLEAFPGVPWKVMQAKMKRLVEKPKDKRIVEGCACGCRGDFYIRGMQWG